MVRALVTLSLALALALALFLGTLWAAPNPEPRPREAPRSSQLPESAQPADTAPVDSEAPTCVGSCSAVSDGPSKSDPASIRTWLREFSTQPLSSESPALEALLFHREATKLQLFSPDALALDAKRQELLERELKRDAALLEVRVRDAEGKVRVHLKETRVSLDHKQHIETENTLAQHVEYSGTVKRVGLDHLWVRL